MPCPVRMVQRPAFLLGEPAMQGSPKPGETPFSRAIEQRFSRCAVALPDYMASLCCLGMMFAMGDFLFAFALQGTRKRARSSSKPVEFDHRRPHHNIQSSHMHTLF